MLAIFHLVKGHRRQAVELVAKRGCDGFPQSSFAAKRRAAEDDQVLEMRSTSILWSSPNVSSSAHVQFEHVVQCLQLLLECLGDGQAHGIAGLAQIGILDETVVQRFLEDVTDHLVETLLTDGHEKVVALAEDLSEGDVPVEERVSECMCLITANHFFVARLISPSLSPDLPEHVRLLVHLFHIDVHHATAFAREDVAAGQPRYDVYALHQSDRGLNHSVSLEAPLEDGFVVRLRGRNRPEVAPDLKPLAGYASLLCLWLDKHNPLEVGARRLPS